MLIIDTLLKIIDRIIKLTEVHTKRKNEVFTKLIEPIFNDLMLVHKDYIEMFSETHKLLPNNFDYEILLRYSNGNLSFEETVDCIKNDNDANELPYMINAVANATKEGFLEYVKQIENACLFLKKRRVEFQPVRDKLRVITKILNHKETTSKLPNFVTPFITSVHSYFPFGYVPSGTTGGYVQSKIYSLLEISENMPRSEILTAGNIKSVIDEHIEDHRRSWSFVCEEYIRVKCSLL